MIMGIAALLLITKISKKGWLYIFAITIFAIMGSTRA